MFAQAAKESTYTRKYILERMDEIDIYKKFLGDIQIGSVTRSPFREDKNPSFGLFVASTGSILYKDYATGESGDVFKMLSNMWGCSLRTVYKRIVEETPNLETAIKPLYKHNIRKPIDIAIKRRKFSEEDLNYWFDRYNIGTDTLEKFNVFAIDYYVVDNTIRDTYKLGNPLYAYKVNSKFRIYKPLSTTKFAKWRGNLSNDNVFGLEQLVKSNTLIITKSLKDVMVLHEMGYPAIAPASESSVIPQEIMLKVCNKRQDITILFDNDETGIKFAERYTQKYGIPHIIIDPETGVKDISDYVERYGFKQARNYLEKLLRDANTKEGKTSTIHSEQGLQSCA